MAQAIYGLYEKGELTFGLIGILMGELHFPTSMELVDGNTAGLAIPSDIVEKSTSLGIGTGRQLNNIKSIDPDDVGAVGVAAHKITFGTVVQDAIKRNDSGYSLMVETYNRLINSEVEGYNIKADGTYEEDEKGRINPNSPAFTNELSKITPELLERLKNAENFEELESILNEQGWEFQKTKPGLLPKRERPENWEQLQIGDFLRRHLYDAVQGAVLIKH
jgi:hypothetical protein